MLLEGEIILECLFFDKPRRARESGNPDYYGGGWQLACVKEASDEWIWRVEEILL